MQVKIEVNASQASYEAATYQLRSAEEPIRGTIVYCCNAYHEAVATNDVALQEELKTRVPTLLAEFDAIEAPKHDNPKMRSHVTHSGWHFAIGEYDVAYEHELQAFHYACNPPEQANPDLELMRKVFIATNLCCIARRLAARETLRREHWLLKSLDFVRQAISWNPQDATTMLEMAMTLDDLGDSDRANTLLEDVIRRADFNDPQEPIAARIQFERELLERVHLPAVKRIRGLLGLD